MESFDLHLSWTGSTADADYPKAATATAADKPPIYLSSGAGEGVDPTRWNPEDTLGASLAWCHTLTFLSLAGKIRADVRSIETAVQVDLVPHERSKRVGRITLRPVITVKAGVDPDKVAMMYDKAHKYCFIANSLTAEIVMEPEVVVVD